MKSNLRAALLVEAVVLVAALALSVAYFVLGLHETNQFLSVVLIILWVLFAAILLFVFWSRSMTREEMVRRFYLNSQWIYNHEIGYAPIDKIVPDGDAYEFVTFAADSLARMSYGFEVADVPQDFQPEFLISSSVFRTHTIQTDDDGFVSEEEAAEDVAAAAEAAEGVAANAKAAGGVAADAEVAEGVATDAEVAEGAEDVAVETEAADAEASTANAESADAESSGVVIVDEWKGSLYRKVTSFAAADTPAAAAAPAADAAATPAAETAPAPVSNQSKTGASSQSATLTDDGYVEIGSYENARELARLLEECAVFG